MANNPNDRGSMDQKQRQEGQGKQQGMNPPQQGQGKQGTNPQQGQGKQGDRQGMSDQDRGKGGMSGSSRDDRSGSSDR